MRRAALNQGTEFVDVRNTSVCLAFAARYAAHYPAAVKILLTDREVEAAGPASAGAPMLPCQSPNGRTSHPVMPPALAALAGRDLQQRAGFSA